MKKKGFTLVELLVVIAIIALLMGILMPALARVRQIAYRLYCGTNLSGIGKAMLIYSNDYDDELPRAGGPRTKWGAVASWNNPDRVAAFNLTSDGGRASITSCFYLLVKYAEVTPKSFLCKGDSGVTEFKPTDYAAGVELIDCWDFGTEPQKHCSYSYHQPFGLYTLTSSAEPGMAIAADPNPWQKSAETEPRPPEDDTAFNPDGSRELIKKGNALTHQENEQNVLFMDGHVNNEKNSACAINDDNIYRFVGAPTGGGDPIKKGVRPAGPDQNPTNRTDSLLLTDGGGGAPPKTRCFVADTPVWVDGKMVPICEVALGQAVAKPAATSTITSLYNDICSFEVEEVQVHDEAQPLQCFDIVLETGNKITVADSHIFQLDSGRWISLQKLAAGMKLATLEGSVAIKSVTKKPTPFYGKVYNLKIKNSERYLVGEDAVIVRDW